MMRSEMRRPAVLLCAVWWLGGVHGRVAAQSGVDSPAVAARRLDTSKSDPQDAAMAHLQEQQAKLRNEDRQKKIVDDTAKLYRLAGELKEEVARSDKNTLSVDVVKKAEEIERLARSVKEKMKG